MICWCAFSAVRFPLVSHRSLERRKISNEIRKRKVRKEENPHFTPPGCAREGWEEQRFSWQRIRILKYPLGETHRIDTQWETGCACVGEDGHGHGDIRDGGDRV